MVGGLSLTTVSFNILFDAIMMVVQVPITFVLYKREDGKFKIKCFSIQKNWRARKKISELVDNFKERNEEQFNKNIIPIWNKKDQSKYWILIIKNDPTSDYQILDIKEHISEIKCIWDAAGYKITKIFDPEYYSDIDIDGFLDSLVRTVERRVEYEEAKINQINLEKIILQEETELLEEAYFNRFLRGIKENTTNYKISGQGVLDLVYEKVTRNLIASSSGHKKEDGENGKLPNFLLFVRDYNAPDGYSRHEGIYDYRARILVCSKQREDFRRNFEWIAKHKKERAYRYLSQISKPSHLDHENHKLYSIYKKLAKEANREFLIKISSSEGIEEILNILEKPYGKTTRSMSDRVFDSSVSLYRDPFSSNAGLSRIFPGKQIEDLPQKFSEIQGEQRDDVFRTITVQYLLESMVYKPFSKDLYLWITLSPIQIAGTIWGVAGYTIRVSQPQLKPDYQKFFSQKEISEYNKSWLRNYQAYQTVKGSLKRNLRIYLNKYYEQFVSEIYAEWAVDLYKELEGIRGNNKASSVILYKKVEDLNSRFRSLSRVFPYDVVQVNLEKIKNSDFYPFPNDSSSSQAFFSSEIGAIISVIPNKKFIFDPVKLMQVDDKLFIDNAKMAIAMSDAFIKRIAEGITIGKLPKNTVRH